MMTDLSRPLRRFASAILLTMCAAQLALAAPASPDSLKKYFEVNNVPALVTRAIESMEGAKAKEWQEETNPALKAEKKAQFQKVDAVIRKYITWKALEPVAMESYQRRLEETDVRELIAFAESPAGRVRITKLSPAVIEILPAVFAHMDKRVDEINARKEGTPAPAAAALAKPAAGSKEALALTMLTELPGAREEFKLRMAGMEAAMLKAAAMVGGASDEKSIAEMKRSAAQLQREITYEEIVNLQAKLLANKLTETELTMLINEHRKPALAKLLAKQQVADRDFGEGANKYMAETIMPALMGELMEAMKPAAKKKPAKK